jgi:urease beta subunit
VPAEVPTGAGGGPAGAALDHPRALIEALQQLSEPIESRNWVLDTLLHQGEYAIMQFVFFPHILGLVQQLRWETITLVQSQAATTLHVVERGDSRTTMVDQHVHLLKAAIALCSAVAVAAGFTKPVAQWVTTNLRPAPGTQQLRWTFDLDGIAEMYDSYEAASMWELLQQPPQGLSVDFVRAEQSSFRWEGGVVDNIQALGHRVHLLRDAGHVVHQDNPSE